MSLETIVEVPVRRVLLTEDRAQVSRMGRVELPGGPITLRIQGASPLLVDATAQASASNAETNPVEVLRLLISRRWSLPPRESTVSEQALSEEIEAALREAHKLDAAAARTRQQLGAIRDELSLYTAILVRNGVRGHGDPGRFASELSGLEARMRGASEALADIDDQRDQLSRRLRRLHGARTELRQGAPVLLADLLVTVDGPPGPCELEIHYLVPQALWRPAYEAHLVTGPEPSVRWDAIVTTWQRTGEDWVDVEVVLSTARPSAGTELPPLQDDRLTSREKTPEERKVVDAALTEQQVQRTALAEGPQALPGVDDGGEVRVLRPPGRFTIPSDGRPHRVLVGGFSVPASTRWRCTPELALRVFRHVELENGLQNEEGRSLPLLAGPVVLLVDGGYVGIGKVPFVGPNERFGLSFGAQDDLAIRYRKGRRIEERFARSNLSWFETELHLSHMGDQPIEVEVLERVPVSELAQVEVVLSEESRAPHPSAEGPQGPDEHGHLRWKVRLSPGEEHRHTLGFRFETSGRVNLPEPW